MTSTLLPRRVLAQQATLTSILGDKRILVRESGAIKISRITACCSCYNECRGITGQGEERESSVGSQIDQNLCDDLHLRIKLHVKEYRSFLVLASLCPNTYVHHSKSDTRFVQNNFICSSLSVT
mmetsp:Transcript_9797/g.14890  ORF Transcript_9797/g.14890 Transcript_9797/m.14890 type:complete len:124 (-) Transcript_9797:107-478(-)